MANLIDLLQSQLSDGIIDQLSQQIGAPKQQTRTAADSILSSLIGGLAKNVQQPGGAESLASALDNDHDGSLLDNLNDLIGGKAREINPRAANGDGILKHVLGQKKGGIMDMVSQISGLTQGKTGMLMSLLAPIVLGMLGKQKRQSGLDAGGIASILMGALGQQRQRGGLAASLLNGILDRDGDGTAIDDVAAIGMNIFSKFFRK